MTSLFLIVLAILFLALGIWMFCLVLAPCRQKPEAKAAPEQQIVIEDEDESEVDRQNREYGDFYGDSYYW